MTLKTCNLTLYRPCIFGVISIRNWLLLWCKCYYWHSFLVGNYTNDGINTVQRLLTHPKRIFIWQDRSNTP